MAMKPAEVRAAREFLRKRGIKGISPRKFARSATELDMTYKALLGALAGVTKNGNNGSAVREGPDGNSSAHAG